MRIINYHLKKLKLFLFITPNSRMNSE